MILQGELRFETTIKFSLLNIGGNILYFGGFFVKFFFSNKF